MRNENWWLPRGSIVAAIINRHKFKKVAFGTRRYSSLVDGCPWRRRRRRYNGPRGSDLL